MDDPVFDEIEIEESNFRSLKRVAPDVDTIVLENRAGVEVVGDEIAEWLGQVPGIEYVQSLVFGPSSRLADVSVIRGIPNLLNLQINSLQIRSLDGIEAFRKGRYINIDTGRNRQRSIAKIHEVPIVKMTLQYAREEDLASIAGSSTLMHLELSGAPRLALKEWREVPLETLGLSTGNFRELSDTAQLKTLTKMTLIGCRKLEKLIGDNSVLTWLAIQHSPRLDLQTLKTLTNLESLIVGGDQRPFALSVLTGLEKLRFVSIDGCPVRVDLANLRIVMPVLETLHISGLKADHAVDLSRSNEEVLISTGRESYRNGRRVVRR